MRTVPKFRRKSDTSGLVMLGGTLLAAALLAIVAAFA